ncbi:MAG: hypothetical protein ACPLKV_00880 [Minisyncoccia bacterium]
MQFLNGLINQLPFVYFVLTAGLIIGFKKIQQLIKPAVILILILKIAELTIKVIGQFLIFKNSEIAVYLLPPYQKLSQFFLHYIDYRFLLPAIFPILVGLLFFFLANILNRLAGERFFEKEEPWMLFYAIIFLGHPMWLVYIFLILIIAIILYLVQLAFKKIQFNQRLPLYYLWLPLAIVVFFLQKVNLPIEWINNFINSIRF